MRKTLTGRIRALGFSLFPAYFGTGAHLSYISDDWRHAEVVLPLTLRTRNYRGTIFGGSIYGAVDPLYMVMLIKCLGPEYSVWDKAASIRFLKPGKGTLRAVLALSEDELAVIRAEAAEGRPIDREYVIELADATGKVSARVEKTIYIRKLRASQPNEAVGAASSAASR